MNKPSFGSILVCGVFAASAGCSSPPKMGTATTASTPDPMMASEGCSSPAQASSTPDPMMASGKKTGRDSEQPEADSGGPESQAKRTR